MKRTAALAVFRAIDSLRPRPQRYALVLSHMRAGSTLLLHLLATSRHIISAGERNVPIATERDLRLLAVQAYWMNRTCKPRRYVADQINHGHLTPVDGVLRHGSVRIIVLIREPRASVASMTDVLGRYYDFDQERAIAYYGKRLRELTLLARRVTGDSSSPILYLTYDQLVHRTAEALTALGTYLGLDDALSDHYVIQPWTGRRGDPSATIRSGRVRRPPPRPGVAAAAGQIDALDRLYRDALDELAASGIGIVDERVAGVLSNESR